MYSYDVNNITTNMMALYPHISKLEKGICHGLSMMFAQASLVDNGNEHEIKTFMRRLNYLSQTQWNFNGKIFTHLPALIDEAQQIMRSQAAREDALTHVRHHFFDCWALLFKKMQRRRRTQENNDEALVNQAHEITDCLAFFDSALTYLGRNSLRPYQNPIAHASLLQPVRLATRMISIYNDIVVVNIDELKYWLQYTLPSIRSMLKNNYALFISDSSHAIAVSENLIFSDRLLDYQDDHHASQTILNCFRSREQPRQILSITVFTTANNVGITTAHHPILEVYFRNRQELKRLPYDLEDTQKPMVDSNSAGAELPALSYPLTQDNPMHPEHWLTKFNIHDLPSTMLKGDNFQQLLEDITLTFCRNIAISARKQRTVKIPREIYGVLFKTDLKFLQLLQYEHQDHFHKFTQRLFQKDANYHCSFFDDTPLFFACAQRNLSIVEKLLRENQFDINKQGREGYTLLHIACEHGHPAMIELLLKQGSNINLTNDHGYSSLHIACKKQDLYTIRRLLQEKHAHVNLVTTKGNTALHIACKRNNYDMIILLLRAGATNHGQNKKGKRPFDYLTPDNLMKTAQWTQSSHSSPTANRLIKDRRNKSRTGKRLIHL